MLALALSVAIAGCGDDDAGGLASMAPPDAPLYAEFVLQPDDDQAEAITAISERVTGIEDPGAMIVERLNASFADSSEEIDFEGEIEPWLGDRGAVFIRSFEPTEVAGGVPDFAALLELADPDEASAFLDRVVEADADPEEARSYGGYDYRFETSDGGIAAGVVDETLVVGTEASFKVAVDAAGGESLAASEDYQRPIEALPEQALGSLYLKPAAAIEAAIAAQDVERSEARMLRPLLAGPLSDPVAIALTVSEAAASIDLAMAVSEPGEISTGSPLLAALPADAWLAFAVPDLGAGLDDLLGELENSGLPGEGSIVDEVRAATGLELRTDVLDWLGDAAGFVRGSRAPGFAAGVVVETDDPEGPRALLDTAQRLAQRDSGLRSASPPEGAGYGFSLGVPGLAAGAEAGVFDDRLVAVLGATAASVLEPEQALGDDERFQAAVEALGDDYAPGLFVYLPPLFAVAEQGGAAEDPDYRLAAPYLDAFESLIAGSRVDDGLALSRVTVTLAE